MLREPMEALSPRSANLPMMPPPAIKKARNETRTKTTQPTINPDKIDEKWRPADLVKEPGPDEDVYLTGKKLGRGGFAVCFEGRSERTKEVFALKVVKCQVQQKKQLEKFQTELQIHAKMHHPAIVEFYRAFAFENHTYVVLELCPNGSLMDMVKNRKSLTLPEVRRYMIQLCGGVKYMHHRMVIHRDLKMGNIFIDANMNIKIGDFGLAAVVVDDKERRTTMCGTPNYIAPELLVKPTSSRDGHGHKVDTWAVGIICYAMLIGSPPFASKSQSEIYAKVKQLEYEWKEDCQYFVPNQAKDLVTLCLKLEPNQRPGMDDLIEHDFFKMGVIAEELDRSCLRTRPTWLEHADPRGDKAIPGYGVGFAAMCEACGVGKTLEGQPRPTVGRNLNVSAWEEVKLENLMDCAPIVPMPEAVIYKEFASAKENWSAVKKRPMTATKVKSRKEAVSTYNEINMDLIAESLPTSESSSSTSKAYGGGIVGSIERVVQPRAPTQSFAAQQRQQALPSGALGRRVISSQAARRTASKPSMDGGMKQTTEVLQVKRSSDEKCDTETRTGDQKQPPSKNLLREQPVRVSRTTRSASSRNRAQILPVQQPESKDVGDLSSRKSRREKEGPPGSLTGTRQASRIVPAERTLGRTGSSWAIDGGTSSRPVTSSPTENSAGLPQRAIEANDRQTTVPQRDKGCEQESLAPRPPTNTISSPVGASLIAPTDIYAPVAESSPEEVLDSLRSLYNDLSPRSAATARSSSRHLRLRCDPHQVVEKWVDYTDRYGIGYILSDGSAGLALRSSPDNAKSSSCVVIRNAREHYPRRIRQEDVQIVPQGSNVLPVEFYERLDEQGICKVQVPARAFRYGQGRSAQWVDGREVVAQLSAQAKDDYSAERLRLIGLLDKFGKYMTNLSASEGNELMVTKADSFIKFYQRLGNVGIWGFGDGSFQFNFPDHTKLIVYRSGKADGQRLMLDLYYLQPDDAVYLAKYGSMTERSMEQRDSITTLVSDIITSKDPKSEHIFSTNQVLEKLSWIRGVVGVWVREGGLGRTGKERLAWSGLQDRATERGKRARMVWVTVGREGGDGEVSSSRLR